MAKTKDDAPTPRSQTLAKRASGTYSGVVDKVSEAASGLEANPVAAIVGGLALGAIAGAMLPRSEREKALLEPTGTRVKEAARAAFDAAREAGGQALTGSGFGSDALKAQGQRLVEEVTKAATAAGTAAIEAARASGTKR